MNSQMGEGIEKVRKSPECSSVSSFVIGELSTFSSSGPVHQPRSLQLRVQEFIGLNMQHLLPHSLQRSMGGVEIS